MELSGRGSSQEPSAPRAPKDKSAHLIHQLGAAGPPHHSPPGDHPLDRKVVFKEKGALFATRRLLIAGCGSPVESPHHFGPFVGRANDRVPPWARLLAPRQ